MTIPQENNAVEQKNQEVPALASQSLNDQKQDIQQTVETVENKQDRDWKRFKEAREVDRKRADEAMKLAAQKQAEAEALKAAMDTLLNQRSNMNGVTNQEIDEEEAKIDRKVSEIIDRKEKERDKKRQQEEIETLPQKLRNIHSDFDVVCSPENLDYLEFHHPELSKSLGVRHNNIEKWNDIYNAVKRYIPNPNNQRDQQRIQQNMKKPVAPSASGIADAGGYSPVILTEERRNANWQRMQREKNSLSNGAEQSPLLR